MNDSWWLIAAQLGLYVNKVKQEIMAAEMKLLRMAGYTNLDYRKKLDMMN
jgi:hypothetical protein